MKYLQQFSIILLISVLGELMKYLIPLPVPASIYGLLLMLIALVTGLIKTEHIENTSDFLLEIMGVAFIPGGVGLITSWDSLKNMLVPALVITVAVTVLTIGVTGIITQITIRFRRKNK